MRISTQQLQLTGISTILDRQSEVSRTQNQIATGKRILSPADDPAGAASIENFRQAIGRTEQFQDNIILARQRLQVEESKLGSVTLILPRIRELAIQGNNDTLTDVDRRSIASEVRQRLDEMLAIANTRDANGEYIFSGFQGKTQPFSQDANGNFIYSGDQGQRFLQVNQSRQIADRDSGAEVFQVIRNGNGTFTTQDNTANTGTGIIDPGSVTDPTLYDGDTYTITMASQATVTSGALVFVDASANDTLQYELRINGFLVNTYNEGDSRTLTELAADINADVGSTGVRAHVDTSGSGTLYLANDPSSVSPITINETLTGATDGAADTLTGFFGSALTGAASTNTLTAISGDADSYIVTDSSGNVETSGAYQEGSQISFNGIATDLTGTPNNGDSFTVSPSANQDIFSILENLATALEGGLNGGAQDTTSFHNAMNRVLADLEQAEEKILEIRGTVGSRLNVLDSQEGSNEDFIINLRASLANIEELDFAEATGRFNLQMVGLEAAQQVYVRVQGLSLFNYL